MKVVGFLENHASWRRKGKGRRFDFFATDADVQSWLNTGLPAAFRPYFLCGPSLSRGTRRTQSASFIMRPEEFLLHRAQNPLDWEYWLFSEKLTSSNDVRLHMARLDKVGSINGLVFLQHGLYVGELIDASSLGVVDRVVNINTKEERHFKEYLGIYNNLKKRIKMDLSYSTEHIFPGGQRLEDSRLLMTENVAASIKNGTKYLNEVGRKLRGQEER